MSIHHEVLDHQSIRMLWIMSFLEHVLLLSAKLPLATCRVRSAELLLLSKSFIWVMHAELIAELLRLAKSSFHFLTFDLFFDFVSCDVGHFIVTQSHSVDVSCLSALRISSVSRIIFRSFFCSLCVVVFK